jgi:hypothetical protein
MNSGGSKSARQIQFGKESVAGVPVNPTALWRGMGNLKSDDPHVFPEENIGVIGGTNRNFIQYKGGTLTLEETPATFEQLPYILGMGVSKPVITADSGSGYAHKFELPKKSLKTIDTYSVVAGDNAGVENASYLYARTFTISGVAKEELKMSAELGTREVRELFIDGLSGIAFVASTSSITDSNNRLGVFSAGQKIKVENSTSNDGTYTIVSASAGEIIVSESLTDETAVSIYLRQEFDEITIPEVEEIIFAGLKVYVDDPSTDVGTTRFANSILGFTLEVTTGFIEKHTADGRDDFSFIQQVGAETLAVKLDLTFEHDRNARNEWRKWKDTDPRVLRLISEGSELATAGSYENKTFMVDLAGAWEIFPEIGEEEGNDIYNATFKGRYDQTADLFGEFTVVNELASLP